MQHDETAGAALIAVIVVAALIAIPLVVGAVLYARDYRIDATVQETRCDRGEVAVKTKQFGIDHTVQDVPRAQCDAIEAGNFVQYRVRSQRTTVFDVEGGRCIYDSKTGPNCGAGFVVPVLG